MPKQEKIDYTEPLPSYINPKNILTAEYKVLCTRILNQFLLKHQTHFEWWLNDEIGTEVEIGGYLIKFQDIIFDLESDQPKDCIWDYMNYISEHVGYMSYIDYTKIHPTLKK